MISSQTAGAAVILDQASAVPVPLISEVSPGKHHVKVTAQEDPYFEDHSEDVRRTGWTEVVAASTTPKALH